ncbi:MAG: DUF4919 domain-containing protein [Alphaproteobacteria bacterium]|nr:MAG: DUF4919 domain-containing protein [Alphaproteobacteria bacterium]
MALCLALTAPSAEGARHMASSEPAPAQAAAPAPVAAVSKDQEYLAIVNDAITGKDADWQKIRDLYVHTSFYDPYGGAQAIWYMLQRAGQQVVYEKSQEAMQEYNTLLAQHYAHYRSHMQALDMIEKGHLPQTEKAAHAKAMSAIISSIIATGDGKTPETAFRVIDPAEENIVLKTYFHYTLVSQEFRQKEGHFWDVLNYTNPNNKDDTGSLYFNVDTILTAPHRNQN